MLTYLKAFCYQLPAVSAVALQGERGDDRVFPDFGVNVTAPQIMGDGDAMVAILDKVYPADFDQVNRLPTIFLCEHKNLRPSVLK